jgi:hypothetical protein
MPQDHIVLKTYENAVALVHPHSHVLQIYRDTLVNKYLIAEYHGDAYLSWEYVSSQSTSRAEQLLRHHEK